MSDSNPYASPGSGEPQAPNQLEWQVQGTELLVKHGAVLPAVDLETGHRGENLVRSRRVWEVVDWRVFAMFAVMGGGTAVLLRWGLPLGISLTCALVVSLVCNFLLALRSPSQARVVIIEFLDPEPLTRRRRRKRWRMAGIGAVCLVTMITPFLVRTSHADYTSLVVGVFATGLVTVIGLLVWSAWDRSRAKSHSGPRGWVRISPVHPAALTFLQECAAAQSAAAQAAPVRRKQRVQTIYLHRLPVRTLLGGNFRNPWRVFVVTLMKWLRSPQLVRVVPHHSEADKTEIAVLCEPLQSAVAEWQRHHPDWREMGAEIYTYPDLSVMDHLAILASPTLEHCIYIHHLWPSANPTSGVTHALCTALLADGKLLQTCDPRFVTLPIPGVRQFYAAGTPAEVFEAHLENCAGESFSPPASDAEWHARRQQFLTDSDRHFIAAGYRSEPRDE